MVIILLPQHQKNFFFFFFFDRFHVFTSTCCSKRVFIFGVLHLFGILPFQLDSDEHGVKIATSERPQRPANLRNLPVPKYNMLLRLNGTSVEMTNSAKKSRLG